MSNAAKLGIILGVSAMAAVIVAMQTERNAERLRTQAQVKAAVKTAAEVAPPLAEKEIPEKPDMVFTVAETAPELVATLVPKNVDRSIERMPLPGETALPAAKPTPPAPRRPVGAVKPATEPAQLVPIAPPAPAAEEEELSSEGTKPGRGAMARYAPTLPPQPPAEDLPLLPSKEEIAATLTVIRPNIQDCYDRTMVPGQVTLSLTVAGQSGKVIDTDVSADSSTAACLKRVASSLKFPKFAQHQAVIRYPYVFE